MTRSRYTSNTSDPADALRRKVWQPSPHEKGLFQRDVAEYEVSISITVRDGREPERGQWMTFTIPVPQEELNDDRSSFIRHLSEKVRRLVADRAAEL